MTVEEWKQQNPSIQRKQQTNADRIRTMSDEELAGKFEEVQLNTICWYSAEVGAYGNNGLFLKGERLKSELKGYWLDWLRQEAEEGR